MSLIIKQAPDSIRAKLNRHLMPNIVYLIEIEKRATKHIIVRYAVHQKGDDVFSVSEVSFNKSFAINDIVHKELKSFPHKLGAKEYVEQMVTQAELDGFEYCDEFEQAIFDVTALPFHSKPAKVVVAADFFRENHRQAFEYTVQGVKGGVLSYLMIDPQGVITLRTTSAPTVIEATLTEGDMFNRFKTFFSLPGFRGAIFEVVYNSIEFVITDCAFLGNEWLNDRTITERFNTLNIAAKKVGFDDALLAKPYVLSAREWLMVNNRGLYKGMLLKRSKGATTIGLVDPADSTAATYLLTQTPATKIMIGDVMGELCSLLCANTLKPLCIVTFPKRLAKKYSEFTMAGFVGNEKRPSIFV